MAHGRNLTVTERYRVVFLRDEGRNISHIADELNLSRNTVKRWLRRFDSEGHVETRERPQRPRIIGDHRQHEMVCAFEQHPFTSTRSFAERYDCSTDTVRIALHRAGITHKKPVPRISLTDQHKADRVRFAREYRDFDFSQAIFTGEKTFESSRPGRRLLWRVNGTRYDPKNVPKQSGHVTVDMWAWMSAAGPGELIYLPKRANGAGYLQILQETMLPTVRLVYPADEVSELVFLQESNPVHKCRLVQNWLQLQPGLKTIPWPSRSPDLNPMETLWAIMVQRWDVKAERTKAALITHVDGVWDSLRGSDLCENLIRSMRSRCDAVIDAGGALTKSFIVFTNVFGTDSFFYAFCVYIKMHFKILQKRFQSAVNSWSVQRAEDAKRKFVEVVKRHQELIHLVDQIEILYSKSTLFNIVSSSVLICLSGFNVTSLEDMSVVFSFLAFLFMSLTQIFLLCYFGDMLMRSSMELSEAVYNTSWYQMDQSMKKNILFVLARLHDCSIPFPQPELAGLTHLGAPGESCLWRPLAHRRDVGWGRVADGTERRRRRSVTARSDKMTDRVCYGDFPPARRDETRIEYVLSMQGAAGAVIQISILVSPVENQYSYSLR
ncbi:hypothetical protein MSG28_012791 [Choristoneura fumiferana]|uniref:Uncharacterized protein n=1 Tax=Choristoneura fumiferana TaxID=7141 RepID=A0ACC0JI38_CHOFU|nr:hypothetical protein MSG28_012791 [Choristoneura fumiferana]